MTKPSSRFNRTYEQLGRITFFTSVVGIPAAMSLMEPHDRLFSMIALTGTVALLSSVCLCFWLLLTTLATPVLSRLKRTSDAENKETTHSQTLQLT